jgi:AcrR family transcriptional regulator
MKTDTKPRPVEPEVRERLLAAATRLFAEKGYAVTTVQEIVQAAGVTKPVLYYYYRSKAGLFTAILDRAKAMHETMLETVRQLPGSTLDRLICLYRSVYTAVIEHRDLYQLIHNLLFGPPKGVPPYDYDRFHARMIETVQTIYREGVARGEVVDAGAEEVAMLVLGLMDFCFHHDQTRQGMLDPSRPERLLRLAFRGLLRRPAEGEILLRRSAGSEKTTGTFAL